MSEADIDNDNNIVITRIPKNSKEEIVAALTEYKSHPLCNLRTFANYGEGGTMRPTRKGICFRITLLPQIIAALHDCQNEARRRGLLPAGGKVDADIADDKAVQS